MGTQWTNKYAILRDLSYAQGRKVPAELVGSIGIGEKPPSLNIKEETEEEFYKNHVGDGDSHTQPDLGMIKHFLNEVREIGERDINDGDTENILEIFKLNPSSEEFVPNISETSDITGNICINHKVENTTEMKSESVSQTIKQKKKRRERNFALISLLEKELSANCSLAKTSEEITSEPLTTEEKYETTNINNNLEIKLLKPNDFIIDKTVTEAVDKVNEWLQTPAKSVSPKTEPVALPISGMFKRKKTLTPVLETTSMFKRRNEVSYDSDIARNTVNGTFSQGSHSSKSNNVYVPSAQANEYYKKYVQRIELQQVVTEDLWERAQREMKEIDAKRLKLKQAQLAQTQTSTQAEASTNPEDDVSQNEITHPPADVQGMDLVRLPQHRHEISEECVVCLVLCKPSGVS